MIPSILEGIIYNNHKNELHTPIFLGYFILKTNICRRRNDLHNQLGLSRPFKNL